MLHHIRSEMQSVFALYKDSHQHRATVRFAGLFDSFQISEESFQNIMAQAEVTDCAGYDDDPSAAIWWLAPNNLINDLTEDEQETANELLWQLRVEKFGPTGMPGAPRSKRGSRNVMNRIAHKRRRNSKRRFF